MTTQADIKLTIDLLNTFNDLSSHDKQVTIDMAIKALKTLGDQVAARAAVTEILRDALHITANKCQYLGAEERDIVAKALLVPTDSKQVLQEWLDEKLGEPVVSVEYDDALNAAGWEFVETCPEKSALLFHTVKPTLKIAIEKWLKCSKMFKKPEKL